MSNTFFFVELSYNRVYEFFPLWYFCFKKGRYIHMFGICAIDLGIDLGTENTLVFVKG
ncbi:hypothetical protein QL293_21500, partial [Bacillus subtilis]|nr:hypothetical protein [Bacillus subtilis]